MPSNSNNRKNLNAFTLIEIMIVIVILAITITFALLAFGDFGQTRHIKAEAQQIVQLITLAEQQAILQPGTYGVQFSTHAYQFYRFVQEPQTHHGNWQVIKRDRLFAYHNLGKSITLKISSEQDNLNQNQPQIIINNSGDITPFTLDIGKTDQPALFQLNATANGDVNLVKRNR